MNCKTTIDILIAPGSMRSDPQATPRTRYRHSYFHGGTASSMGSGTSLPTSFMHPNLATTPQQQFHHSQQQLAHSYGAPPIFYGSQYMQFQQQQYLSGSPHAMSVYQVQQQQCVPMRHLKSMSVSPSVRQRRAHSARISTRSSSRMSLQTPSSIRSSFLAPPPALSHSDWGASSTTGHNTDFHTAAGSSQWAQSEEASSQWLPSENASDSQWDNLSSCTLREEHINDNDDNTWEDELSSAHTMIESSHLDTLSGVPTIVETNSQWDAVTNSQWDDVSVSTMHRLSSNFDDEGSSEHFNTHSESTSDYTDDELSQVLDKQFLLQ